MQNISLKLYSTCISVLQIFGFFLLAATKIHENSLKFHINSNDRASARTSGPRPASGCNSDACNRFASDAHHARIRSHANELRQAARNRSRANDRIRPSATQSPSRLRPRRQARRAHPPSRHAPPLAATPSPPCPRPLPRSVSARAPSHVLTSHLL